MNIYANFYNKKKRISFVEKLFLYFSRLELKTEY